MKLELKKFDINTITNDKVVVMIGKRNTGKSYLIKNLLYYHKDLPIGTVISGTESANHFFESIVPKMFIHDEYQHDIIDNVVRRQQMILKKINKETTLYGSCKLDPRSFLILDDCLYDSTWTKDRNVRALFMNGRHLKMFFIISMQYPLGIPPNLRTNIDFIFILRENIVANRRRIYDNYAGMFPTFEIFSQVLDQCTENFECLVIDNTTKSNKIEDTVFWYKAHEHENFEVCLPTYWEMSRNLIEDDDDDDDDPKYDPSFFKKKLNLKVVKK